MISSSSDANRELLRHTLATLAYRGGKAVRNAPDGFAEFRAGDNVRTPVQILAHIGDLFDWGLSIAKGKQTWREFVAPTWNHEVDRVFAAPKSLDDFFA